MLAAIGAWIAGKIFPVVAGSAWKWIAFGLALLVLAGLVGTIILFKAQRDQARAEAAQQAQSAALYLEANRKNLELFARYRAESQRNAEIAAERERQAQAQARVLADMYLKVVNAPDSDDGPVAPVLRDALRGLRDFGAAGDRAPAR